jgi:hypothetical protein
MMIKNDRVSPFLCPVKAVPNSSVLLMYFFGLA